MEEAIFGAGCFWGVEATFQKITGVASTEVGYAGGHTDNPTYEEICSSSTGHAEVVALQYDPAVVSYETLLQAFWESHDPTTQDRQGPDIGTQYRSCIFTFGDEQQSLAEKSKAGAAGRFENPIVSEIKPAPRFWRAEDYHQKYFEKQGLDVCPI